MKRDHRLDLTLCVGESLFSGSGLGVLERVLANRAASWFEGLRSNRGARADRKLVDDFADAIRGLAAERGDTFRQLVEKFGPGPNERRAGSIELRGSDESLIVVVDLDESVFAPSAGRYLWGNTVSFQFCRRACCGTPAAALALEIAADCCRELNLLYAHGHLLEEWDAKNMAQGGSTMAVGLDVSRYLPGLYWLNYFGKPYADLIGEERLLAAPAFDARSLGDGVLIVVDEEPESWDTNKSRHADVLSFIGDQYFFLRDKPDRQFRAPAWGLAELPRFARFT